MDFQREMFINNYTGSTMEYNNFSCSWNEELDLSQVCVTNPIQLTIGLLKALGLGLIILLTIGGNVLVLMAVALSPNLRSSTHYLIVNLAIADLGLGMTVLPFSAVFEITGKWYFGEYFCGIWAAIDVLYCTASIFSLCAISVDRYIGVNFPLSYSTIMLGKRTSILIVLIWVLSITISIGPLFGWKGPPSMDPYDCTINKELGYVLFSATGSFYLPMLIILIVYWKIYKAAIRQTKFLECGTKTTKQDVTLRIHLGGANGRANSTPDLAVIRTPPKHNYCAVDIGTHHGNGHAGCHGKNNSKGAPLARPEHSSNSSHHSHVVDDYSHETGIVLRVHRGGGGKSGSGKNTLDVNWTGLTPRPLQQSSRAYHPRGQTQHNHQHTKTQSPGILSRNCLKRHGTRAGNGFGGSRPNSLTPSPPSSSPERKLNSSGFGKLAKFRRQKKAAKTLAIVVGAFLLCWFPFFFILPLDALCKQCNVPAEVFDLFFWLGYLNSCLNPFIYACTSKEFQRAFRRILCRRKPPRPHASRAIYRTNLMQNRFMDRNPNCNGNSVPMTSIPLQPINQWN